MTAQRKFFFVWLLFGTAFCCAGCLAVGQSFKLAETLAMLAASGAFSVVVAARDRRSYVANGSKDENFVGVLKGGFGNPFNVKNAGGQPLASTFSEVIARSLKQKGYQAAPVIVSPMDQPDQVKQKMLGSGAQRVLLLDVDEWRSETMTRTAMNYDVTLSVMDQGGNVLAKSRIEGRDVLGGSFWNPAGLAKRRVPQAFKNHIEQLLNHPDVVAALSR